MLSFLSLWSRDRLQMLPKSFTRSELKVALQGRIVPNPQWAASGPRKSEAPPPHRTKATFLTKAKTERWCPGPYCVSGAVVV